MKKLIFIITILLIISCSKGEKIKTEEMIGKYVKHGKEYRLKTRLDVYLKNNKTNVYLYILDKGGWKYNGKYDYEYIKYLLNSI